MKIKNKKLIPIIIIAAAAVAIIAAVYYYKNVRTKSDQEKQGNEVGNEAEEPKDTESSDVENESLEGFDLSTKENPPSGGSYVLNNIEFGSHDNYERLVITLSGGKNPSYRISEVDNAKTPLLGNKNENLSSDLSSFRIQAELYDVTDFNVESGAKTYAKGDFDARGEVFGKVKLFYPMADNTITILAGLKKQTPFKIIILQDPTRIVIDVAK